MALSIRSSAAAAGCLTLALALPLGMTGCSAQSGGGTGSPATKTAAEQSANDEQDASPSEEAARVVSSTYHELDSTETFTTSYTYDDAGRLVGAEDATATQKWAYDDAGRLVKEEIAYAADEESAGGKQTITYTYDENGALVERLLDDTTDENIDLETGEPMTDPDTGAVLDDHKRTYAYEDGGKKMTVTTTNADGQWIGETVSYFAESAEGLSPTVSVKPEDLGTLVEPWKPQREEVLDQNGEVAESSNYTYNAAGDITTLSSTYEGEDGKETIVWNSTYDDKGHETMTSVSMEGADEDAQETPTEWTYDDAGRAIEKAAIDPFFGMMYEFYSYDSAGRLKSVTYVQPQSAEEIIVGCQVFDYAADNEDPAQTPEAMMTGARDKVKAEVEASGLFDEMAAEDEETFDLSDLKEGDLEGIDLEGIALEDLEGVEGIEEAL